MARSAGALGGVAGEDRGCVALGGVREVPGRAGGGPEAAWAAGGRKPTVEETGGGGAELRWSWRYEKGGRDLFGICENSRDFTVNKNFPLF